MKKIISVVLVVVMLLPISLYTFSMENTNKGNDVDEDVLVVTQESFDATFTSQKTRSVATEIEKISYSYELTESEDNEGVADVTLNIVMVIGNNEYPITVSGSVEAYELSSGCILWEGPIRGNTTINGVEYNVIAGFSKMDDASDIQVSLTLQGVDEESSLDPIVLCFGENVITSEVYAEIANTIKDVEEQNFTGESSRMTARASSGDFTYIAYDYSKFQSGYAFPGYAQCANAYLDYSTNRFMVAIRSYVKNVNKYFSETGIVTTSIREFTIKLERDSVDGSYIAGIERCEFDDTNKGKAALIKPLFEDAMGLLGAPTSTISTVLDSLKGTVTWDHRTDVSYLNVKFGLAQKANFDASGAGVPLIFQLGYAPSKYPGSSTYTFTTSMMYLAVYLQDGAELPQLIYIEAYDASGTVTFSLE